MGEKVKSVEIKAEEEVGFDGINPKSVERATARAVIEYLLSHPNTPKDKLTSIKARICKEYGFINVIRDSVIREYASPEEIKELDLILRRRKTRTLSGVTIVAVMTKPYPCPGKCVMCPGPESQPDKKVAQSYTGKEPAAMRSAMYNYDPYLQTFNRLKSLHDIGHVVDKIELIVMGGTFLYLPYDYQKEFMKGCFDAIINFGEENYNDHKRTESLEEAIEKLHHSKNRLIGVTFETRPDYCFEEHVDRMLEFHATRVEIGVQSTRDDLLLKANRGHTVDDIKKAIRIAKDAGLKVNAHIMPNLPGSSPEIDYEVFKTLFEDPDFRPDMLKIYPTLVVKGTKLYEWYVNGEYVPYSEKKIVELIARVKSELIPPYVRIQRIQRDIPAYLIVAGVKHGNLRQIVHNKLKEWGKSCNCIRCREHGFYQYRDNKKKFDLQSVKLYVMEYEASKGKEFFISFENKEENVLLGYLRLRFPSPYAHRPEFTEVPTAIVREIRVVGEIVHHGDEPTERQIQHRGFGKKLLRKAEEIAMNAGYEKISVIAGLGVREYFFKRGYAPDGPYVSKYLR